MSIYIGGSCVGYGSTTSDTTVNEIRFVQSTRHDPISWNTVEMSLANRIKMIVNIDSYGDGSNRGWHSEINLRTFTETIINQLIKRANAHGISYNQLKRFCRFTLDNEADEIYSPYTYGYYLDIFHRQIAGRFDVGAGNFSNDRKDYFEYICKFFSDNFEIIDIHLQTEFETIAKIDKNIVWYKNLAKRYNKRISCTEANPTTNNIWTARGFNILHYQLKKAIEIGCEDFCMVFIKQPELDTKDIYRNLSFIRKNGDINPYWEPFRLMIKGNKPIEIKPILGGKDGMIIPTQVLNKEGYLANLENELLANLGYLTEEDIGWKVTSKTVEALKLFQTSIKDKYPKIMVDGKCGRQTFRYLIEEIPDSIEKANYRFALEVYASPTK